MSQKVAKSLKNKQEVKKILLAFQSNYLIRHCPSKHWAKNKTTDLIEYKSWFRMYSILQTADVSAMTHLIEGKHSAFSQVRGPWIINIYLPTLKKEFKNWSLFNSDGSKTKYLAEPRRDQRHIFRGGGAKCTETISFDFFFGQTMTYSDRAVKVRHPNFHAGLTCVPVNYV